MSENIVSIFTGSGEPVKLFPLVDGVQLPLVSILTGSGEPVKLPGASVGAELKKFQSSPAPENR